LIALLVTLAIGTQTSVAASSQDRRAPDSLEAIQVAGSDAASVTLSWSSRWRDERDVAGYGVYVNAVHRDDVARALVKRVDGARSLTVSGLSCGTGYTVGIDVYDDAGNRSAQTKTTVSTAACPDTTPPSLPTGIRQVAVSETSVVLAWTPSNDPGGVVEYGLYVSGLKVGATSEPSATVPNLECGRSYSVGIDAADAAGNRSAQTTALFSTAACVDRAAPSAPTNLQVTGATQTTISMSWTASRDDVGVTAYGLYVGGKRVASTTSTSATFSGLTCGGTNILAVDATDRAGNRSNQSSVTAATRSCDGTKPPSPTDTRAPSAPPNLRVASATQTDIVLRWDPATDNTGVVNYRIYRNGSYIGQGPGSSGGLLDQWTDRNRTCGTSYQYAVEAQDAAGNTGPRSTITASSAACSQTSPPPTTDTSAPSAPPNLRVASATQTQVGLRWDAATDNVGVAKYRVFRDGSSVAQLAGTSTAWTDGSRSCGSLYQYGVDAQDAAGNTGPRSTMAAFTPACVTTDTTAPTAPTNLTVSTRTATSISLTWTASADDTGVAGYGLYRGGTRIGSASGTTGIFSGLTCATSYTLAVDAFDVVGNDSQQAVVMVSTTPCPDTQPPSTPTGLTTSNVSQTGLTLGWRASTDNVGVTGYDIYRNSSKIATATTLSSNQSGLACGTSYTLGVAARDAAGNVSPQAQTVVQTSSCSTTTSGGTLTGSQCSSKAAVAGAVISNATVNGGCDVTGQNVTFQNVTMDGGVVFEPSASGGKLLSSSVLNAHIFGADNVTIDGTTVDCRGLVKDGSIIWDQPAGDYPQGITIRNSTYKNCKDVKPDDHSQAIYLGYSRNVLIENNYFTNNGSTSHIFATWFGNQANPATTYPRDVCIRGNTFGPTAGAYYDFNYRAEIPVSANIKVQRDASGGGPFYGDC
jgi:chitodextrinase